ncbi:hypothetical protein BS47DRAFT_123299 [Hydnum rufescens UP504]|uniref:Uncharacterized protein n=1 Tax=Hydnum rufescens UP504 TaxID=1448309 RepID=A0A9P6DZ27_9AGAM|nr:hypothetical protein BS47DRAFT_123299 [Hydnum rufescens UP504]
MPRSLRATLSHRAVAHFLLYGRPHKNKNSRRNWSPRFGHGPSPLRQMTSLDDVCSSSSGHSSPASTTSSLSDCDHEMDFPVTPPMGLIDDGVIEECDMDDDSHFSPAAEVAIVDPCTTTKPLELRRMAIRLGLSLITGPAKQSQIHKRVPVPSISPETFTAPPCPAPSPISGSHPLGRWKSRGSSSSAEGRGEDSFRLIEDTGVSSVGMEVEVRKTRWERLAARPRLRAGAVAVCGNHKARG